MVHGEMSSDRDFGANFGAKKLQLYKLTCIEQPLVGIEQPLNNPFGSGPLTGSESTVIIHPSIHPFRSKFPVKIFEG